MKITDLMTVLHHQITTLEHLEVEVVAHPEVKDLDIHKKVQRIRTLHKLLDQCTIPRTGILHTNHHLLQLEVINVSNVRLKKTP